LICGIFGGTCGLVLAFFGVIAEVATTVGILTVCFLAALVYRRHQHRRYGPDWRKR